MENAEKRLRDASSAARFVASLVARRFVARAVGRCTFGSATGLFRVISSRAFVFLGCSGLVAVLGGAARLRSSADIGGHVFENLYAGFVGGSHRHL